MKKQISALVLVGALALTGCSSAGSNGGDGDSDADAEITVDTPIGPPEKTDLTIAIGTPNLDSQAPVFIAKDKGYYEDEGLTVNVIDADAIREGLVGGSLDLGVDDTTALVDAAEAGTGLEIVAGYRARQPFIIAADSDINKPEDLAGKQIILGAAPGTPEVDLRVKLLKEDADFDIEGVDYKDVYPPGFSNAWVENFLSDQAVMSVIYPRHIPLVEDAGKKLLLNVDKEWPNDSVGASAEWVEKNPNTLARFIRATTKAMQFYLDLDNQDYVQSMMEEKYDFDVTDTERMPEIYAYGPKLYNEDMTMDPDHFDADLEANGMKVSDFDSYTDTLNLERAMRSLEEE